MRDLVALVAAQVLCALLARRLLVGLGQAPLAALSDFSVVALFALVLGVALLAAARHRLAYSAVLGAGCTLASLHCFLLAVNVPFVNVIGGPLTFQWLYLSDFFRTQTPWQSASAAATRLSIAFCLLGPLLPPTALWLVRKVKPLGSIAGDRAMGLAMAAVLMFAVLLNRALPPKPMVDFDSRSSPVVILLTSLVQDPSSLLHNFAPHSPIGSYHLQPAQAAPRTTATSQKSDIVLVVLESVGRRNLLSHLKQLPTLQGLMAGGEWFDQATVTVAESSRSNFAITMSRNPLLGAVAETELLTKRRFTPFTSVLRSGGYPTHLFMSGDLGFEGVDTFLRHQGFGDMSDLNTIPCATHSKNDSPFWQYMSYVTDACTFDAAANWISANRLPSFVMIWTGETHYPYSRTGRGTGSEADYVAALQSTDAALGNFLERLRKLHRPRPTIIVMGDHGEAFGEHGFHVHSNSVYEEELGIPLILNGAPFRAGTVRHDLAKPVDIGPTIVELAGLARPAGWQGFSLLHRNPAEARFSFAVNFAVSRTPMVGLRTRDRMYIYEIATGRMVAYDLVADPGEQHLRDVNGAEREKIGSAMAAWVDYNNRH